MSGYTTCPRCFGEGIVGAFCPPCDVAHTTDCGLCSGTGEVRADVAVDYLEQEVRS